LDCEERETCEVKVKEAVVMSAIARMRSPAVPDDSPTDPFALSLTPAEWLSPRK
jgi:hypothetical protein